jgi:hypothetical protein
MTIRLCTLNPTTSIAVARLEREIAEHEAAAVDESLIDATLALGPKERLRLNDRTARTITMLRQAITTAK